MTAINLELKIKKDNKLHLGRLPGHDYGITLNGLLKYYKKFFNHRSLKSLHGSRHVDMS